MEKILKNPLTLFFAILVLSSVFYISAIGKTDLYSDNSLYTFRAFGWVDYIDAQPGPLGWLGHETWWSKVSFQDGPPLVFFLEYISFKLFGANAGVAQLPFFLAGLLTLIAVYFGMKKLKNAKVALWSTLILAVSSLELWSKISGNLEGLLSLFLVLCFFSTTLYLKENNKKYLYWSFVFLGLSLLSKYTAIFLVPSFLILIYFKHDSFYSFSSFIKANWRPYVYGLIILTLLLSPVIIYNYNAFQAHGRFDDALAPILGTENTFNRAISFNFVQNIIGFIKWFFLTNSFFFALACCAGLLWLAVKSQKRLGDIVDSSLFTHTFLIIVMFGFMGPSLRHITIIMPFLAMALGIAVVDFFSKYPKTLFRTLVLAVVFIEFGYSVNTNLVPLPVGRENVFYSKFRNRSLGFNELDNHLKSVIAPLPDFRRIKAESDLLKKDNPVLYDSSVVVMYDGRINWFARWWYFERYRLYYGLPIFSSDNSMLRRPLFPRYSLKSSDLHKSAKVAYFIQAIDKNVMSGEKTGDSYYLLLDNLGSHLDSLGIPSTTIFSKEGVPTFKVYKIDL